MNKKAGDEQGGYALPKGLKKYLGTKDAKHQIEVHKKNAQHLRENAPPREQGGFRLPRVNESGVRKVAATLEELAEKYSPDILGAAIAHSVYSKRQDADLSGAVANPNEMVPDLAEALALGAKEKPDFLESQDEELEGLGELEKPVTATVAMVKEKLGIQK